MTISDYQISNVIRTYMKNMTVRAKQIDKDQENLTRDDEVAISREGMKRMLFERIGEHTTEKLRKYEKEQ